MSTYAGPFSVLQDSEGLVIPIAFAPTAVPVGQQLTIDVSSLAPPNGKFGYIAGVTVDATGANIASGIISLAFDGGYQLVRNANGGNTQVYRVSGPVLRLTITNLAWTSGTINFVLWNSQPINELQSPLTVVASGAVSISGTPTVQFAPGQTVSVTAGTVSISGTVIIEPGAHSLAIQSQNIAIGHNDYTFIGSGNFTIRSIFVNLINSQSFGPPGNVVIKILDNATKLQTYWAMLVSVEAIAQPYVELSNLSGLAIPFVGGLTLDVTTFSLVYIDSLMTVNAVIGYN